MIRSICVFCGSSSGSRPVYAKAARELGRLLVERGLRLVYGGGSVGLMGILADAVLSAGGEVVGVIPRSLWQREVGHRELTQLHIVETMHERKALMSDHSDGFIALPGGIGTLEEMFEIWTWAQLGIHRKPLGLLNVDGYFKPLLAFVEHAVAEEFVRPLYADMLVVDSQPRALLDRLAAYDPPAVPQWLDLAKS
jgi:uncharacterized protein (TIGR00730 family)